MKGFLWIPVVGLAELWIFFDRGGVIIQGTEFIWELWALQ
jgi:hypothetical protein